jgi:diguanylate cyclase (GGDEF)-like protein/PAS domain S-box-containing protein
MRHNAEANLSALIDSTDDPIWAVDLQYGLTYFNRTVQQSAERIKGFRVAAGMRPDDILPPEEAAFWCSLYERALSGGPFRTELSRPDGKTLELAFNLILLDGETTGISVFGYDITSRKTAEERLAAAQEAQLRSEMRYRAAFQTSLDAISISRLDDGACIECNSAFLESTGYERDEVIGKTALELAIWVNPREREDWVKTLHRHASFRDFQTQFRKKNGELFWGQSSASVFDLGGVPCVLSILRDITAVKEAEDKIRNLAFYDPLTGLPNRPLLLERLRLTLASSAPGSRLQAMLLIDLDNFKTLNDTLGHHTGDLLLQEAARRLIACLGEACTVARFGADEFAVLLEDLNEDPEEAAAEAKIIGEKILLSLDQPYQLDGRECLSSAGIGITVFGHQGESANDVLQQADIAMYQAKDAGRNSVRFFAPALQAAVQARATLEKELRQAVKASEFELYYQPQVDSTHLVGAEALVRWNHPQRGILSPDGFISVAEETGLILPLGDWVLEAACNQIAAWANGEATAQLSVAVNISAGQFRQTDFVQKVLSTLERTGANPHNLELELTESMRASCKIIETRGI